MRRILLLLAVFALPGLSKANLVWTPQTLAAYRACLALDVAECNRQLSLERRTHPANKMLVLVESQRDFLLAIAQEDENAIERILHKSSDRMRTLREAGKNSPYQRLGIAEIHFHTAVVAIRSRKSVFNGTIELRKSFLMLEENRKLYPDFLPNLKLLGLFHAVSGTIPRNYQWAASLLGFRGTINQGIEELNRVYNQSGNQQQYSYLREECIVLLSYLETRLARKTDWGRMLDRIVQQQDYTNRPLLVFAAASILSAAGKNDSLIRLLEPLSPGLGRRIPYLHYSLGLARLQNLDPGAATDFTTYLKFYPGNAYRQAAIQKMAWTKAIAGDLSGYTETLKALQPIDPDDCMTDEDKAAVSEAQKRIAPQPGLLKARLLFDGGYYTRAAEQVHQISVQKLSKEQQLERSYRLARILDKSGNLREAIPLYTNVFNEGKTLPYVYSANAALSLGELYERSGNPETARSWFEKTLELRHHEYQNSIDQKARAGLDRVRNR
ncbi:MAG: tetratricopeptide repeat protein [Bacteroidota bacterium]